MIRPFLEGAFAAAIVVVIGVIVGPALMVFSRRVELWANRVCGFRTDK